jgi:phenylglyoxylate dehydrogenase epsilon subunit
MIEKAFRDHGIDMAMGETAVAVEAQDDKGFRLKLAGGGECAGDLLLIAAGVRPVTDFLAGSGVDLAQGVLVDARMRTSVANVWAAGDVAQADRFLDGQKAMAGILPNAVEQGRIAGADMAGDSAVKPFPGSVPLNTFAYFGNHAISVGALDEAGAVIETRAGDGCYIRLVIAEGRLRGISAINHVVDAGLMWQLILRRIDLAPVLQDFLARPHEIGRVLMSRLWR